ncbi:Pbf1p [Balamuthia mandrillaris]
MAAKYSNCTPSSLSLSLSLSQLSFSSFSLIVCPLFLFLQTCYSAIVHSPFLSFIVLHLPLYCTHIPTRPINASTEKAVIATSGMQADQGALHKVLQARLQTYEYEHRKPMSTPAIAQLLSTTLYHKRFFPYYTFNVLGGLDEEGRGVVYSYDAVGSFERVNYSSSGTGQQLLQPLLDNQIGWKDQVATKLKPRLTQEETVDLLKDIFTSAGERDIYTGDSVDIIVIDASGVKEESFALKKD